MSIFRDPGGKASMTRTCAFILVADATLVSVATVYYLVAGTPTAGILLAVASVLGALVAAGVVAILNRTVAQP